MRRLNRARDDERGATLIIVAVTLVTLLMFGALVIDVGALVQERRTLQNGADAAALAVAKDCAGGTCGAYTTTAGNYADANADDGASTAENVCGVVPASPGTLPACTSPPSVAAGVGYVRVTTRTRTTGGSSQVPFHIAQLIGLTGATVRRQATVAWGGPASLTSTLPLTISLCEFNKYVSLPGGLAPPPPYPPWPTETTIYFHNTTGASPCPAGPSGADLPGGFGWLKTSTDCQTPSSVGNWFDDSTGRPPPSTCDPPEMKAMLGKVIFIPIYDDTNGLTGSNGQYHIKGYGAFYLTGYSINGQYKEKSLKTNAFPCGGSDSCISGFFVKDQLVSGGTIGGPSMGVTVISVIG